MAPKPVYQKLNSQDIDDEEEEITTTTTDSTSAQELTQVEPSSSETDNQPINNESPESDAPPPPYEPASGDITFAPPTPTSQQDLLNLSPPLYTEIVKLPTYNESQNIESDTEEPHGLNRIRFFFISRGDQDQQEISEENIGTDIGFILCFVMAFIFNGLGFLVAYCSTNTLSSHYGAFSGFGLSLVKWAFIVKHRDTLKEYFEGNEWILYCVVLLGWMIFLKGIFSYAQLKRAMASRRRRANEEIVE